METMVRMMGIIEEHRLLDRPLLLLLVGKSVAAGLVVETKESGRFKVPVFDGAGEFDGVPVHVSRLLPPDQIVPVSAWGLELALATREEERLVEGFDHQTEVARIMKAVNEACADGEAKRRELRDANVEWTELLMALTRLLEKLRTDRRAHNVHTDEALDEAVELADGVVGRVAGRLFSAATTGRARMVIESALGVDFDDEEG